MASCVPWFVVWLLPALVSALSTSDLLPYGFTQDQSLSKEDDVSSLAVPLSVPIVFYGSSYSTIYVNDNGLLSFATEVPRFYNGQFPLSYPIIAPLYSDVDIRDAGRILYRETQSEELLRDINQRIHRHFSQGQGFLARSLFIVTWDGVGSYNRNSKKVNTFQVVLATDGTESYSLFLYPDGGIQWIQGDGKNPNQPDARAQSGFMSGLGQLYTLRGSGTEQTRNLDKMTNIGKPGVWMFNVGNISPGGNVMPPDLDTEGDFSAFGRETCATTIDPCPPTSTCIDHGEGFCCDCEEGFFGNGRTCLQNGKAQRGKGKVNGIVNDIPLNDVDLDTYVVTEDGRTYTAISRVDPSLGIDMQSLLTLGGVFGWLFALPRGNTKNGFMLTGGEFNRTAEISFTQTGHQVQIREHFQGVDVFDYLKVSVELRGSIPTIPHGTKIKVEDYEEEYTRVSPGVIRSHSTNSFQLEGSSLPIEFIVDQTITFKECPHAPEDPSLNTVKLKVARNFILYDENESIVRFAHTNKISPLSTEDPCKEGRHQCGQHSKCIVDGDQPRCVCDLGYESIQEDRYGERVTCIDTNECQTGRHNCHYLAECLNLPGSFACRCLPGYTGNGIHCERPQSTLTCQDLRCDANAVCIEAQNQLPYCRCQPGFEGDGQTCRPVQTVEDCRHDSLCDPNADCVYEATVQSYVCRCRPGYRGDGVVCLEEHLTCDVTNNCHPNADCLYDEQVNGFYCACIPGYAGDGYLCYPEESNNFLSCIVRNDCHPHAQCTFNSTLRLHQCKCNAGYAGNGYECIRRDEIGCNEVNICSVHGQCVYNLLVGRYICQCNDGYDGDGIDCTSTDECSTVEDCDRNAQCIYDGSSHVYRCQCNPGYTGDGKSCTAQSDASCNIANNCSPNGQCMFDFPSRQYRCQCNSGYIGDGIICQEAVASCKTLNNCHAQADCIYDSVNLGFRCRCRRGYEGDGIFCRPQRSCIDDLSLCDSNADCIYQASMATHVCQCKVGYNGDGQSCTVAPRQESDYLVFGQGMLIMKMPLNPSRNDPGNLLLIEPYQTVVGIAVDCANEHVYWTDAANGYIRRAYYNGSSSEVFFHAAGASPEGIAIDWVSRNIYWTDSLKDTIEVMSIDHKHHKVLIKENLVNPRGIALHPSTGKLYWTDWNRDGPKIEMANLDGSGRTILVSDNIELPNMIAIDLEWNDLCWTDAGLGRIECMNLNGLNRRVIFTPAPYPFGLTLTGGFIYWTDWEVQFIHKIDRNGGTAEPLAHPPGGTGRLYGIASVPTRCPRVTNSCSNQNGGCQFLCLPSGQWGRTCMCPDIEGDDDEIVCNDIA